jgi:hypothetical protein
MTAAIAVAYVPIRRTRCKNGSVISTIRITEDNFETAVFSRYDPFPHIIDGACDEDEAMRDHDHYVFVHGGRAWIQ